MEMIQTKTIYHPSGVALGVELDVVEVDESECIDCKELFDPASGPSCDCMSEAFWAADRSQS